jgi:hypothetical protein
MADLLVRNINPKLKREISRRARAQGRSMSDEVKSLLDEAVRGPEPPKKLGTWLFDLLPPKYRGDDLVFEYRGDFPKAPDFD